MYAAAVKVTAIVNSLIRILSFSAYLYTKM